MRLDVFNYFEDFSLKYSYIITKVEDVQFPPVTFVCPHSEYPSV